MGLQIEGVADRAVAREEMTCPPVVPRLQWKSADFLADPGLRWERRGGEVADVAEPTGRAVQPHGLRREGAGGGVRSDVFVVVPPPAARSQLPGTDAA
jgi:hypothetical protein